jgi:hypothetical protein
LRATEGEIDIVENALATHSNVVRFIENKGEIVGFALSQTSSVDLYGERGFDSLHPLHFSTLQSEQFTASMEL